TFISQFGRKIMSLTIEEKRNLKTFWISLYGPQANQWPVNADMFDLTYKLLEESKKCSDLIDMVPRPMAVGQSPMSWLSSEVRGRLLRTLRNNKEHYVLCVKPASLKMKTQFAMKASGL
ncbi:hypothetical protein, partial [Vibrio parahaemolyticus]